MSACPTKKLNELCRPRQWPTLSKAEMLATGVPVYGANGIIGFTDKPTHVNQVILIGCRGSCGTVHLLQPPAYANGNAMALDELRSDLIDLKFLEHYLRHRGFADVTTGASQPQIVQRNLNQIQIPLPPFDEQRRIAAILDQADELRRKRQRALDRLNQLGQSIFHEMFGDLENSLIPFKKLKNLTSKIGSGATPRGGDSAYKAEGISLIRSMNVRDGEFSSNGLAFLDNSQASKLNNVIVRSNDVLLNITGASVARVCRAPSWMINARVNQHVSIIRVNDELSSEFLEAFLLMPKTKRKLLNIAESGATRQAITKAQIEDLPIPVPDKTKQALFASYLTTAKDISGHGDIQLKHLDALFASLQHRAFRGEL